METRTATGAEPVAPWARRFVWAFLAAFVIAGVFGIEAWPLTGWRLFADARTAKQVSWQGVTAAPAGRSPSARPGRVPSGHAAGTSARCGSTRSRPTSRAGSATAPPAARGTFASPAATGPFGPAEAQVARLRAWAGRVEGWLFAPGDPRRLAGLRIGLCGVLAIRLAVGPYLDLAHQPAALFRPI